MIYRQGNIDDIDSLKQLALASWQQYKTELTPENWEKLFNSLNDISTFSELLANAACLVCETIDNEIVGMAFLVPRGNPTEIYDAQWSYIRFVSVHPDFTGQGIGRQLTENCIALAKKNNETIIALHTSEMMNSARNIYESLGFKILKEIGPRLGKRYWVYVLDIS